MCYIIAAVPEAVDIPILEIDAFCHVAEKKMLLFFIS